MWENLFGFIYKWLRWSIKSSFFSIKALMGKPKDLEGVVTIGHSMLRFTKPLWPVIRVLVAPPKQTANVEIYDLNFANPLTFAAYESNINLLQFFLELGIGGGCYKTMMTQPRSGNARPRLQEITINNQPSLINALGLPGNGAKVTINSVLSSQLLAYNRPLGLSIGGDNSDDYLQTFMIYEKAINTNPYPFYYEINISCPNTESGQCLADNPDELSVVLEALRAKTNRMISVKLSPDLSNQAILTLAEVITKWDKMMINAGNTTFRSCEDVGLTTSAISKGGGGLSGPSLFPRTLEVVGLLKDTSCPIMATGGVHSKASVQACLNNGANLVGMATALVMNPFEISKILKS